ncbi:MAG TPA: SPFH domain-containing protein [Candidatus Limnocylindria bacterium]|nr:SPFH domain-containing protein [Candidatus Limnocylindria bacterium]
MPDLLNFTGVGPLLGVVLVVVLGLLVFYVASRYRVANANEALIVAGSRGSKVRDERGQVAATTATAADKGIRVVVGGGTFVLPLIHKVGRLKLTARQISVALPDAVTSQGIKVAVQGVATFKIGRDVESIRNAAERFLEARDEQVDSIVKNVLEGSLRSIVGTLTIEELIMDRQKLLQQVQDSAKGDLATSGLQIDAFTIQSINDESGYVDLLGQQKLAIVERDARVAKAGADQEAAVREAEAEQVKINAQRDVELRRAEVLTLTAAAQSRAGQAGPLAQAEAQQEVTRRQTELAELEAARKEKELLALTVRPAEADAEAVVRRAEGDRQARIAAAQADAEREKLAGQAQAAVIQAKGEAQAKVVEVNARAEATRVTLEGNAEAEIVFNKGEAEAKALALRAEAFKQFNEAAVIQTVLGMLPDIVRAAAEPMGRIDNLTVLSNDGASELVRNTTRTVTEASATVKGLTGLDVPGLINTAMAGATAGGRSAPGGTGGAGGAGGSGRLSGSGGTSASGTAQASASRADGGQPARPARGRPARGGQATQATAAGDGATGTTFDAQAAGAQVDAAMQRASQTMDRAAGAQAVTGALGGGSQVRPTPITAATPLAEAATILADQLRVIPGIERYGEVPLAELEQRGSRPVRAVWRLARERVAGQYGGLTVGELLGRFGRQAEGPRN